MKGVASLDPVAKLLAALATACVLVLTIDWVSASTALVLEAVLLPFAGIGWARFWRRTWPVWLAGPLVGLTVLLYGAPGGRVLLHWGLVQVSDASVALSGAMALRVLAIGLPSVVLFVTVDPTDLADGLAQILRLPARFVLGALAAFRLVGLFADDWRALGLARRARGVADRGRARRVGGQAFALLVLAVRRGGKLATAMEARAFGAPIRRTWARPSRFGLGEAALVAVGVGVAAVAATMSIATGNWHFAIHG